MIKKLFQVLLIVGFLAVPLTTANAKAQQGFAHSPELSPDGSQVLFVNDLGDGDEIYVSQTVGGGINTIALNVSKDPEAHIGRPSWSPSGEQISFILFEEYLGYGDLCIYTFSTEEVECPEQFQDLAFEQDWGPYNLALTMGSDYCGDSTLVFVDPTTMEVTKHVASYLTHVSWSSSGRLVASSGCESSEDWYVLNAQGDLIIKLETAFGVYSPPAWKPNSPLLSYRWAKSDGYATQILNVASGDSTTVNLLVGQEDPSSVSWSPDGTKVAFASYDANSNEHVSVYYYVLETDELYQIATPDGAGVFTNAPVWINNETLVAGSHWQGLVWLSTAESQLVSN